MKQSPEQVLDTCLAELNRGADLEVVLAAHPEHADELRPMLAAAALVRMDVPPPVRKSARKQGFLDAVAAKRREVETTEGYIVELKAGVPFSELLDRATPEMRPLIHAAWRMYTTEPPAPSAEKVADGKLLLMAMAEKRRAERRATVPGVGDRVRVTLEELIGGLRPRPSAMRRAWSGAVAALLMLIVLSVGVAGVGSAAASSLPGEAFYGVKELGRSAQLLFMFDPQRKAELSIEICGQRLDEIQALTSEGRVVPIEALEEWVAGQQRALANIQQLPLDQRQFLVEMLLATSVGRDLRGALADPDALDDILERSGDVLDLAKASAGAAPDESDPAESAERPDHDRSSGELPPEKTVSRQAPRPKSEPDSEPSVVSPPAEGASEPADELADPAEEAAAQRQYVQPADDDSSTERSSDRDRGEPAGEPGSGEDPAAEPEPDATEPSPPAFSQPIFEDPTDTPEPVDPDENPADPGGAPDEPPPDEPQPEPPPPPEGEEP